MKHANTATTLRTCGRLILRGHGGRHRKAGWYFYRPLTDGQVMRLYDFFKDQPTTRK